MELYFLNVPGLANSGPRHWQTIWEEQYPSHFSRVEQDNWDLPVRSHWVQKLQEKITTLTQPTIFIAHSLGCLTVAHWAAQYESALIKGAFLVAPADAELSGRLSFVEGFKPIPQQQLPFPSVVVASTNDIYAGIERSAGFAKSWGSDFINIGNKGHVNAISQIHDWPEGKEIVSRHFGLIE